MSVPSTMSVPNTTPPAKPARLKARLPRGLADRGPAEIAATERMIARIRSVYERYGFEAVETPAFEYTEALGKFLPDLDRPNEGVFSLKDDDDAWISLRYDLTAPLARYVAENFDRLPKPYRSYRAGYVYRNEKPGPGRFRQFMQFDADTVGAPRVAADAEMCMMAADALEAVGIKRGQYVIKVNNRKVLDGVMEAIGLGGEDKAGQRLTVLRAIDKLDRLGVEGVRLLLGPGRWDGGSEGKGDFAKGAMLSPEHITVVLDMLNLGLSSINPPNYEPFEPSDTWREAGGEFAWMRQRLVNSPLGLEGASELEEMDRLFRSSGYDHNRIRIDSSVVRGLEYYTGPVFEAELTFEVKDDKGRPVRFGSVGGGGRYDGLVGRFRPEAVPATGFSVGVSRLQAALTAIGSPLVSGAARPGPVVVCIMDKERTADYQRFVSALRAAGIVAELYLGGAGMKAQLKYADKRGSPCVVIQGSDEAERGAVQIKDLIAGAKAAEAIATNAEWKAQRPAQFEAPVDQLVEKVREIVLAHFPDEDAAIASRLAEDAARG